VELSEALLLVMPNVQQPFEIDIDASGFSMDDIHMWGGRPINYHSELFQRVVLKYPTYDQEIYMLVKEMKT
jgi:hypothetical protein